ncbi:MAG: SUF system Fe-S cluster assembly protein [Alphaproteobacteria bacterium]
MPRAWKAEEDEMDEKETPRVSEGDAARQTEGGAQSGERGSERPLEAAIIEALGSVYDPEIPVNIYELGLIYNIEASEAGDVEITMTLTTPNCPVAGSMPGEVERAVSAVEGVGSVKVNLVWEPPWSQEKMSEAARLELGCV